MSDPVPASTYAATDIQDVKLFLKQVVHHREPLVTRRDCSRLCGEPSSWHRLQFHRGVSIHQTGGTATPSFETLLASPLTKSSILTMSSLFPLSTTCSCCFPSLPIPAHG